MKCYNDLISGSLGEKNREEERVVLMLLSTEKGAGHILRGGSYTTIVLLEDLPIRMGWMCEILPPGTKM